MKIIAEVGSNWATLDDCKKSISQAKLCGADAVKFQLFNYKALYGLEGAEFSSAMPVEWLPQLKDKANAVGIELMCSAFSPELAEVVNPFVSTHKVASAELSHIQLLEKLRELGKPVILSCGARAEGDIKAAIHTLKGEIPDAPKPIQKLTLMYCVSEYPARTVDLQFIPEMIGRYLLPVGFSDHTTDVAVIPAQAKYLGAEILEKHVNFVAATGPDSPFSLSGDEFKNMCQVLKGGRPSPPKELDMRTTHNRRLIATKDIKVGDRLIDGDNFGIFRSLKPETSALSPWAVYKVNGRSSAVAIKAGDGVSPAAIGK